MVTPCQVHLPAPHPELEGEHTDQLGLVVRAWNLSYWGGLRQEDCKFEACLSNLVTANLIVRNEE